MIPALWVELESLPLTPNGKIDRKALPDPDVSELLGSQYVAPRNVAEEKLVVIWQELVGVERIGIHDNFFEIGGHSLLAMRVISAIRKELEVELDIKDIFQYSTISDLSDYIELEYDFTKEFDTISFEEVKI
jgi:acyl carrier protein